MPPVDAATAAAPGMPAVAPRSMRITGWGGGDGASVRLVRADRVEVLQAALESCRAAGGAAIPRGMGRSYGDAAQLEGGLALDATGLKGFELDAGAATVTARAGVTIGELLGALVPAGFMVPVVPGTQHVSVGGAIASDIHGKSHAVDGTLGSHVQALGLLTSRGEVLELARDGDDGSLAATIGGMGLTGVILWARIGLRRVASALLSVDTDRVDSVPQALEVLSAPGGRHRVAWLDLLCARPGRGVVTRAEHLEWAAPEGAWGVATVRARATVPQRWPGGLLRPATVRMFNELRFRRAPRSEHGRLEAIGKHMFPLDALDAWPRLYGPGGLLQYQLVVPRGAEGVLETVIRELSHAAVPCYLAVLKDFGHANEAPLSFPLAGWTLAMDIPRDWPGVGPLLDRFDELVAVEGGRVYLSKDVRLRPDSLNAMYPRLAEWRAVRDKLDPDRIWQSDLAVRTGLVPPEPR